MVVSSGKSQANTIHVIYCFQDSQLFFVAFRGLLYVVLSMESSTVQGDLVSDMVKLSGVPGSNSIIQNHTLFLVYHCICVEDLHGSGSQPGGISLGLDMKNLSSGGGLYSRS